MENSAESINKAFSVGLSAIIDRGPPLYTDFITVGEVIESTVFLRLSSQIDHFEHARRPIREYSLSLRPETSEAFASVGSSAPPPMPSTSPILLLVNE
ncbi:hypothetical protein [Halocatena marina]|uniref:Uncharacterized protein n=1 Tax=Halocatena marina TaxID=2934937 RepID=A0ABD5YUZ6_9EURY|nr:hypothetical protein [Halocatena marina]